MHNRPLAFTIDYPNKVSELRTQVKLGLAFDITKSAPPPFSNFNAIWDTGASKSVISPQVVQSLGLKPSGKATVVGAHGSQAVFVYHLAVILPNEVGFPALSVTECAGIVGSCDMLIGMDIIGRGDFAVTRGSNGGTSMSYSLPRTHSICFLKMHANRANTARHAPPPPALSQAAKKKARKKHR